MIYFLSDFHGEVFPAFKEYIENANENDLLIVLGDVGIEFEDTDENRKFTEYFMSSKKNIAFIDGNHENFGYMNSFPEEEWNGGIVNRLTDTIVHLKRGNAYNIDGKKFFAFGGCKSTSKWKDMGLWFPGEEATDEEIALAYENLKKYDYKFDYILTHKYEETPGYAPISFPLQELTKFIDKNVEYKMWYAGHWHRDDIIDEKHVLVYNTLTPIAE